MVTLGLPAADGILVVRALLTLPCGLFVIEMDAHGQLTCLNVSHVKSVRMVSFHASITLYVVPSVRRL